MKEFDDALIDALKKLPELLKYLVEERGYYDINDEIYLRVDPDESCEISIALWTHERFDNLDEFLDYMENEKYKS